MSDDAWTKQDHLRLEATSKSRDDRYPPAMKAWLREKLVDVYSKHIPEAECRAILDDVWPATPDEAARVFVKNPTQRTTP